TVAIATPHRTVAVARAWSDTIAGAAARTKSHLRKQLFERVAQALLERGLELQATFTFAFQAVALACGDEIFQDVGRLYGRGMSARSRKLPQGLLGLGHRPVGAAVDQL